MCMQSLPGSLFPSPREPGDEANLTSDLKTNKFSPKVHVGSVGPEKQSIKLKWPYNRDHEVGMPQVNVIVLGSALFCCENSLTMFC